MTEAQDGKDGLLWNSFLREAGSSCLNDAEAVIEVAVRLIADWGSNRAEMGRILLQGVERGELTEEILERWDGHWCDIGKQATTPGLQRTGLQQGALPPELLPFEKAI